MSVHPLNSLENEEPSTLLGRGFYSQNPMHEVAPSAVRTADAIDTTICAMNLMVSFLVMVNFVLS